MVTLKLSYCRGRRSASGRLPQVQGKWRSAIRQKVWRMQDDIWSACGGVRSAIPKGCKF